MSTNKQVIERIKLGDIIYSINKTSMTASIVRNESTKTKIFIPRTITYLSKEYLITRIFGISSDFRDTISPIFK